MSAKSLDFYSDFINVILREKGKFMFLVTEVFE